MFSYDYYPLFTEKGKARNGRIRVRILYVIYVGLYLHPGIFSTLIKSEYFFGIVLVPSFRMLTPSNIQHKNPLGKYGDKT